MKAVWIVQNFGKSPYNTELIAAARDLGHEVLEIKNDYSPSLLHRYKNGLYCLVFNGSVEMADTIYHELKDNCFPIKYYTSEHYACHRYYPYFSNLLFNDNVVWTTVEQFLRKKFFYYRILGKEALIFARPDAGNKIFQAGLYDLQDIDRIFKDEDQDILILLAAPKKITGEYRFIVSINKEIIAHSTYLYQEQITQIPAVPQAAIEKCQEALERNYFPDSVFVIDICEDNDGNCWVLEINSFSSAGLYACDKKKIVKRVSEIAEEEAEHYGYC